MIYGTAAKGNKPGFINANPLLDPALMFAEEEDSWNVEVGTKNHAERRAHHPERGAVLYSTGPSSS